MEIAVVGGGIAGLTTALSLHAAGLHCTVYEAVPEPKALGVGINLLPHAMRELEDLGLLPDLRLAGIEIDRLFYLTKYGKEIWQEPRGVAAGYHWPQIAIHRGRLQMLLLRAVRARLGDSAVRFGHRLRQVESRGDTVYAYFADRVTHRELPPVRCDLLAAADGIHSSVRRCLYPAEGPPKWNGRMLWRATSRGCTLPQGRAMLWAGHSRQKFVAYPIRTGDISSTELNWICELQIAAGGSEPPAQDWNRISDPGEFVSSFKPWQWSGIDVPQIVRSAERIYVFPMVDRDPLPRWTHGCVTLLGDAAHPMYPIGSNGATQAIIDARAFAYHLAGAPSLKAGLEAYESERRPATERIVTMNRANGPDQVMELAEQRALRADDDLDTLLPLGERQAIAAEYKRVAGFDPAILNARASYEAPNRPTWC